MTRRTRLALLAGIGALLIALPRAAHAAEAFYAVTTGNTLITFQSDAPGAVRSATPMTGLAPGEQILGLDVRPQNGQLYALGSSNRVYVVSPISGAVRAAGDPFSPPLAGTGFGFDFNPAVDRIRVVSDGRQNMRLNPDNGAVSASDPALDYAQGDAAFGQNPNVTAAAYSPDGKVLFDIDVARDTLARQDPPNDGKLKTVGALGQDIQEPVGFDIAASGTGFVSGKPGGAAARLFTIDGNTGRLSPAATFDALPTIHGDVRAIAAAGPVPDDNAAPSLLYQADRLQPKKRLRSRLDVPVSCSEACRVDASVLQGGKPLMSGVVELAGPGKATLRLRAGARGRRRAKAVGVQSARLVLRAVDRANNSRRASKTLKFG